VLQHVSSEKNVVGDVLISGSLVAAYRIERVIGTRHIGTIYLARNPDLSPQTTHSKFSTAIFYTTPISSEQVVTLLVVHAA